MKENFPNLVKEIYMQIQEAQSPKQDELRHTPRHIVIKMAKVKDRENLKRSERKAVSYLQGSSRRLATDFSTETFQAGQKELAQNIQSGEKQGPTTKFILSSKAII